MEKYQKKLVVWKLGKTEWENIRKIEGMENIQNMKLENARKIGSMETWKIGNGKTSGKLEERKLGKRENIRKTRSMENIQNMEVENAMKIGNMETRKIFLEILFIMVTRIMWNPPQVKLSKNPLFTKNKIVTSKEILQKI